MNHNEIKERLMRAETAEQAAAIARECGMELSAEKADRLFQEIRLRKEAQGQPRELDESELEAVSGGGQLPVCKGTIKCDGIGYRNGEIRVLWDPDWCWEGVDYCKYWTETYDGFTIY